MLKAIFVFGTAGAGKTTFCKNFKSEKDIMLINLDPDSKNLDMYDISITEYISLEEVMQEFDFGPNGGLFECLKYLEEIFFGEENDVSLSDDKIVVFDCPGQIELFIHSELVPNFIRKFRQTEGIDAMIAYVTDGTTLLDKEKFAMNNLMAAMSINRFCLPVLHLISKMDFLKNQKPEVEFVDEDGYICTETWDTGLDKFDETLKSLFEMFGFFNFVSINWEEKESVDFMMVHLDRILALS